jgi:hypothetical protein
VINKNSSKMNNFKTKYPHNHRAIYRISIAPNKNHLLATRLHAGRSTAHYFCLQKKRDNFKKYFQAKQIFPQSFPWKLPNKIDLGHFQRRDEHDGQRTKDNSTIPGGILEAKSEKVNFFDRLGWILCILAVGWSESERNWRNLGVKVSRFAGLTSRDMI